MRRVWSIRPAAVLIALSLAFSWAAMPAHGDGGKVYRYTSSLRGRQRRGRRAALRQRQPRGGLRQSEERRRRPAAGRSRWTAPAWRPRASSSGSCCRAAGRSSARSRRCRREDRPGRDLPYRPAGRDGRRPGLPLGPVRRALGAEPRLRRPERPQGELHRRPGQPERHAERAARPLLRPREGLLRGRRGARRRADPQVPSGGRGVKAASPGCTARRSGSRRWRWTTWAKAREGRKLQLASAQAMDAAGWEQAKRAQLGPAALTGPVEAVEVKPHPCRVPGVGRGGAVRHLSRLGEPRDPAGAEDRPQHRHPPGPGTGQAARSDLPVRRRSGGGDRGAARRAIAESHLRQKRDIVLIDQRGTGRSNPLDCAFYGEPVDFRRAAQDCSRSTRSGSAARGWRRSRTSASTPPPPSRTTSTRSANGSATARST